MERVVRRLDVPLPDGDAPYRFATIAASVLRHEVAEAAMDPDPAASADETGADPTAAQGTAANGTAAKTTTGTRGKPAPTTPFAAAFDAMADDVDVSASTELVWVPRTSTTVALRDPALLAWRQWCEADLAPPSTALVSAETTESDGAAETPDFPGFRLDTTVSDWVQDNVADEDVIETATILGQSIARTYRHLRTAMTIIHGLPRFADRVRAGEFTIAHVQVVGDLCRSVALRYLPEIDDHLAERRADVTSDRLRTALRKFIAVLEPADDRSQTAKERRRVDLHTYKNGSACMSLTGPAEELHACYLRVEAMARAIHSRRGAAFDLPPGVEIIDDRAFDNLMYDIVTRPQPKLSIKVRRIDPVTGIQSVEEEPLLDDDGNLLFDLGPDGAIIMKNSAAANNASGGGTATNNASGDGTAASNASANGAATNSVGVEGLPLPGHGPVDTEAADRGSAFCRAGADQTETAESWIAAEMPMHSWWIALQATMVTTVPVMSLLGESNLPGTLPDGSPIPADTARRIAGHCSTVTRILTDPATGTPIDAKATTYRIPNEVRKTLIAQWECCSVPGCARAAVKAEIDHIVPFFKLDPLKGGLTRFGNLHPLCRKHHALKTACLLRVRMKEPGCVEYEFRHGVTATSRAPDQPIEVAQAMELAAISGMRPHVVWKPKHPVPPPKYIIELEPNEQLVRQRREAMRKSAEETERRRRIQETYERARDFARRKRLAQLLNWRNEEFPPCLPRGSDPVTMKRLMPGRRLSVREAQRRRQDAGDTWVEPLDQFWSVPITWHQDNRDDPPPF
ncbi:MULTISPECIES: DUF222 domain-containing protein [unclassified Brevibacterium]|uniref:DUF222 domain-containing protein n=1 Tax=unclassified Brevibacterium TaxID=2614124 RepID=UPI0010F83BF2|nr:MULTISPECIES: DUF222 domain-containing protein [unclassified Brevibacterium]MCM1014041.1 HNH endonuclease [Brevibacterium sp. XM4083]